ncbi:MAG: TAT-variant-translocated molybdopterin oxidoreductase [Williamsia sp.]|nr:TAT-variant-translocated molybdopterin oxidoreductase [Williamsia sp.]
MEKKKYWQSFGELNDSAAFQKEKQDEFKEELPFIDVDDKGLLEAKTPRRDFLKYLGFSTAAAMAAASCEMPVRHSVPYLFKPQDVIPGEPEYYATTYVSGGDAIPAVAKVRDGRPIKIEGNEMSSYSRGGTSAQMQASVLDLYDTARLRYPAASKKEVTTFPVLDGMITSALAGMGGAPLAILTPTITSPTTKQIIAQLLAKYPGRHVQYDAISYSGMLLANETCYGKRALPSYQFRNAKVVVSLGADFLTTWLSPVEFQRDYAEGKRIRGANSDINKLYQFESMMSATGASADERYTHKPSETGKVAAALLDSLNGRGISGINSPKLKEGIQKAAKDLQLNRGKALVISGSNNPNVQIIVNAINEAVGANGTTINWALPFQTKQGIDSEMATLVADMDAGRIGGVILYDVNPAYDYYDAAKFRSALQKVKVSISCNEKLDETAELCKFTVPSHHYLESWGDTEVKPGYFSMLQPTINPLFKTRQFQESLLSWSGNPQSYEAYFRGYWTEKLGSIDAYNHALQDGIVEPATPATAGGASFNASGLQAATAAVAAVKEGKRELVLYQNVAMGDGRQANNPWLQETPDPITRATWDNYVLISPALGKELFDVDITNSRQADEYEVHTSKQIIEVSLGSRKVKLPALIVPGMNNDTIAIAVGYGRQSSNKEETELHIGKAAAGVGQNVFQFASFNGSTVDWNAGEVTIAKTDDTYKVATVQTHSSYEGRSEVMKEMTLAEFQKNPSEIPEERNKEMAPYGGVKDYVEKGTLYPVYDKPGIKWGMSIDLNNCYGCSACVVACIAENNVAVVGKSEVLRYHDMHWLRIDRYFTGNPNDPESIQTVFQPMLCQHCDNAPCENVCPVSATNHNSEGINQMVYNRCIGTRYCANNCPYKVRRFNWSDYTKADSFPDNQDQQVVGKLDPAVFMMNDDLTRMVLNPDVTVRSRGVMEKCSFCVQRLQWGKLKAKKENRVLTDDDAKTACQQACPARAIEFGNVNNPDSNISKVRRENNNRLFYILEPIHTLPNVNYLAKVRNTDRLALHEEGRERTPETAKEGSKAE